VNVIDDISPDRGDRGVRLLDVAAAAGVSTATVARVLHGTAAVRPETERRVQDALAATGYRLNALAQGLRTKRTRIIGHLLQDVFPNPFNVEVALGLEAAATDAGYRVLLFNARSDAELERQGVETFIEWRVDTIVFTPPVAAANVETAVGAGPVVVQVERPAIPGTSTVVADNRGGVAEAVEHLVRFGHRRIGFIGARPASLDGPVALADVEWDRFDGFREALAAHGLELRDDDVVLGEYPGAAPASLANGYQYAGALFARGAAPSALLVASDLLASGVLQWLYEHGLRVPDDVSVVGFDDTLAAHLAPALTTVRLPMAEFGQLAVELAVRDRDAPAEERRLRATLVVRASTGPAPGTDGNRSQRNRG
jgi:LacI family transcriptional regulator, galactose operon repressor